VRSESTTWIDTTSDSANRAAFSTRRAPAAAAASSVRFWLHAMTRMPNTFAYSAMRLPVRPRPSTPSVLPDNVIPVVVCHPPSRMRRCSSAKLRTVAINSPQASSGVASRTERNRGLAMSEWATRTPRSVAAARSRFGRLLPTMVISLRFGSRSTSVRGSAMRSRRVQMTSKGRNASTASVSDRCRSKTVTSERVRTPDQSASSRATPA
jgi:hypothetical protein